MSKSGPETKLVAKMRKAAQEKYGDRIVIIKQHGSEYAAYGVSDLLCCLNGRFIAIEVKAPESYGGSVEKALADGPTVKQRLFVGHVKDAGGYGGFAATVEGFMSILDAVDFVSCDVEDHYPYDEFEMVNDRLNESDDEDN